jgi:predicted dehydrogenase
MRWLCGEITEVSAVVDRVSSLEITTDDIADLTVRFASGAVGNIHMNLFAWNVHSHFELMGEQGVIQWRRLENDIRLYDPRVNRWEVYPSGGQLNDMYLEEARHFLVCIGARRRPAATAGRAPDDARNRCGEASFGRAALDHLSE